jgi:hypothetical protein
MSIQLPSKVFLYIPTRQGYKGLILMNVSTTEGTTVTLTPAPVNTANPYTIEFPTKSVGTFLGTLKIKPTNGLNALFKKRIKQHKNIVIKATTWADNGEENQPMFVLSMTAPQVLFESGALKRNVIFNAVHPQLSPAGPPVPVPVPVPAPAPAPATAGAARIKKCTPCLSNQLSPFVAKQLFDLAVLRKEQCPITVEDFSQGNTAAMPCGHLFMQMAIEESFKKEVNKCPWCRQLGTPTYI